MTFRRMPFQAAFVTGITCTAFLIGGVAPAVHATPPPVAPAVASAAWVAPPALGLGSGWKSRDYYGGKGWTKGTKTVTEGGETFATSAAALLKFNKIVARMKTTYTIARVGNSFSGTAKPGTVTPSPFIAAAVDGRYLSSMTAKDGGHRLLSGGQMRVTARTLAKNHPFSILLSVR